MGNIAQPIELQLIHGNKNRRTKAEIERRRKAEQALKATKDKLKPPTWLDKTAKKEFRFIVNEGIFSSWYKSRHYH